MSLSVHSNGTHAAGQGTGKSRFTVEPQQISGDIPAQILLPTLPRYRRWRARPVLCLDLHMDRVWYLYLYRVGQRAHVVDLGHLAVSGAEDESIQQLEDWLQQFSGWRKPQLRICVSLPGLYHAVLQVPRTLDVQLLDPPIAHLFRRQMPALARGDYWCWSILQNQVQGVSQHAQVLVQAMPGRVLSPWLLALQSRGWQPAFIYPRGTVLADALYRFFPHLDRLLFLEINQKYTALLAIEQGKVTCLQQIALGTEYLDAIGSSSVRSVEIPVQSNPASLTGALLHAEEGNRQQDPDPHLLWPDLQRYSPELRYYLGSLFSLFFSLPAISLGGCTLLLGGPGASNTLIGQFLSQCLSRPVQILTLPEPYPALASGNPAQFLSLLGTGLLDAQQLSLRPLQFTGK